MRVDEVRAGQRAQVGAPRGDDETDFSAATPAPQMQIPFRTVNLRTEGAKNGFMNPLWNTGIGELQCQVTAEKDEPWLKFYKGTIKVREVRVGEDGEFIYPKRFVTPNQNPTGLDPDFYSDVLTVTCGAQSQKIGVNLEVIKCA